MTKEELMRKAIELSKENVANGGGPFGAVIATKEGEIIATGVNRVTSSCDPTAHAEVPYVPQPRNWEHSTSADTKSILHANLARCVWVPSIGHDWTKCIMGTTRQMPKTSVLTIPLFMMSWL